MQDKRSEADEKAYAQLEKAMQTPPDVKIRIQKGALDLIRVVSVGEEPVGNYIEHTEFWNQSNTLAAGDFSGSLKLTSEPFGEMQQQGTLDAFFTDTPKRVMIIGRMHPAWPKAPRTTSEHRTAFLYSMPDPDDATKPRIGVLFELDMRNVLRAAVFYRSSVRLDDRQIWHKSDFSADLTLVKGSDGKPTPDPRYIDGVGNWEGHYTVMGT